MFVRAKFALMKSIFQLSILSAFAALATQHPIPKLNWNTMQMQKFATKVQTFHIEVAEAYFLTCLLVRQYLSAVL